MVAELLIPIGKKATIQFGKHRLQRVIPNAAFFKDPRDIGHVFGGRAAMPNQPIVLQQPGAVTPTIIMTAGVSEAAEIEDLALEAQEKTAENLKKFGTTMDFDTIREKLGKPRREDVPQLMHDAIQRRIDEQKKNWRTDPRRHKRQK